ncbi:SH3-domain-containing protein [Serendipita vermifera]|nr:SH3-domain-containing protein [Serendipita vermifera]
MSGTDGSLITHFVQRLYDDVSRIEGLIKVVHNDVQFLADAGQISTDEAAFILSKVPAIVSPGAVVTSKHSLHHSRVSVDSTNSVGLTDLNGADAVAPPSYPSLENAINNVPRTTQPAAPKRQARALWDYNLDCEEPEDLSFVKGAIIEVLNEDNEDWWTGKCNGRTGIFPSNYVELLQHPLPTWSTLPPATVTKARPPRESAPKYVPYKAAHVTMSNQQPDNTANMNGSRPAQEDEVKKAKYSHLKNTMANSAAGGLGFGAGAAIGSSVARAIF